jgi:CheY-like chemotaxis protein
VATARRKRLEYIHSAGQHLHNLINDVLDLSSLQGGEVRIALQPVALAPVVAATLPLLGPLLDGCMVSVQCGALDHTVMADATRLRQVLLNLLSNAVKYNRRDGQVHIEAVPHGAEVRLRVKDTGRGMSGQQLRHLFEPFNRLGVDGEAIEGTGIGLAIVKTLVERMGGSVHVDSVLGQGSVFEVRLQAGELVLQAAPAAPPAGTVPGPSPAPASAHAPAAHGGHPARRHQVLYVEDNAVNALIIGELLARRNDLQLHVAVDGASGVAQALAIRPDLILLDMQLPDCDGFEVLRRLRAEPATAGIPCIALSANAIPEEIERALGAGLSDYWTKPLDFKAFMASLDALFGKAP